MEFDSGIFAFDTPGGHSAEGDFHDDIQAQLRVALIGTFPPRQCGIATFTSDVVEQARQHHPEIAFDVFALDNSADRLSYEPAVKPLDAHDAGSYRAAAEAINAASHDAVWLQHEYGIYGGPDGEMVCDFVDRLAAPLVLTLHTVLSEPSPNQRRILEHLLARASKVMVMSRHSRDLLLSRYGAPGERVEVIEHGAPDRMLGDSATAKAAIGLGDRPVLMTFGLLGPGKGLEHVIDALPTLLKSHPQLLYRIVGATHPVLAARDGESYRRMLMDRAAELGVGHAIEWDNRFLDNDELLDQLAACDIFVTPYPNLQQSTSGTLSYAVALGKAVVATPYIHAQELLADGVGALVEPNSPAALAEAIGGLLSDPQALAAMQRKAWERGRLTIWPRFADATAALVRSAVPDIVVRAPLSVIPSPTGVFAMSDATGMLQHAIRTVPDRRHGYCLDDNVRALMWINVAEGVETAERMARAAVYAAFTQHAWNPHAQEGRGAFRNFMAFDRTWCEDCGSEDSNGRAFWALGQTLEASRDPDLRNWARQWYDTALPSLSAMRSPRTIAFVMLGAAARLRREPGHLESRRVLRDGALTLLDLVDRVSSDEWCWFETRLGYDNARLPQALIEAGDLLEEPRWCAVGVTAARWLADRQTTADGLYRPVGSESLGRDRELWPFDQQPLEAQASIECALAAYRVTRDEYWVSHAETAWRWFFGGNDRGAVLADLATGRCRDGLNPRGRNENCGAESILALHLSRHFMLALQDEKAADPRGAAATGDLRERKRREQADPVPHL